MNKCLLSKKEDLFDRCKHNQFFQQKNLRIDEQTQLQSTDQKIAISCISNPIKEILQVDQIVTNQLESKIKKQNCETRFFIYSFINLYDIVNYLIDKILNGIIINLLKKCSSFLKYIYIISKLSHLWIIILLIYLLIHSIDSKIYCNNISSEDTNNIISKKYFFTKNKIFHKKIYNRRNSLPETFHSNKIHLHLNTFESSNENLFNLETNACSFDSSEIYPKHKSCEKIYEKRYHQNIRMNTNIPKDQSIQFNESILENIDDNLNETLINRKVNAFRIDIDNELKTITIKARDLLESASTIFEFTNTDINNMNDLNIENRLIESKNQNQAKSFNSLKSIQHNLDLNSIEENHHDFDSLRRAIQEQNTIHKLLMAQVLELSKSIKTIDWKISKLDESIRELKIELTKQIEN